MNILYYDCFCGISGDMNLAVLLDLGVQREYLDKELSKLNLDSEYEIKIEKASKLGITGTRVDVILKNKLHNNQQHIEHVLNENSHDIGHSNHHEGEYHSHNHIHDNENHNNYVHENDHSHCGSYSHNHTDNHEHHHRNLRDIEAIIYSSDLSDKVKKLSMDMFMKVAEAEAKVHGKTLYEVHFHEVGAIDSIVDMVGAAICLDYLNVDKITASPVQVGGGFVKCAHGLMPVPAPATAEILKGIPIKIGIVQFETTTPTGAAILAANVKEFTEKADFSIKKIAYGIGHRDLEIPNVLRVYLGEAGNINDQ